MNLEGLYDLYIKNKRVTTDSRIVTKNALFFALKGENFNGNVYAQNALENGCSYAIIDEESYAENDKYIVVKNVLETLQKLGNYHRRRLGIPILGITGSNGKTTTKELISVVLAKRFKLTYTQGNLNNHIGVPLTLLSMDSETEFGVVEMGANHMKEIKQLCEIAEPDYGIITNIGKAHLEGFGSFENIIKTKKELYDYLKTNQGKVFYNYNNEILKKGINELKLDNIPFGSKSSEIYGEILNTEQNLSLKVKIGEFIGEIHSKLVGNYNLENILAAVSIGNYFNISPADIISAIESYIPKNNRSQLIKTNKNSIILDAYNANPTSVELSVKNFALLKKENNFLVLGDMLELGSESKKEHENIIKLLQSLNFKNVILVGDVYHSLKVPDDYFQFENVNDLKKWLLENNISRSNVLIKGSRGIRLETIVEYL